MNKFLTLAVLGLSSLSLAAAGTDNITAALIKSQHPEFDYSAQYDSDGEFEDFTIVAESGAEYFFNQAVAGTNPQGDDFWATTWNHYGSLPAGYMTSTKSGGYITKIVVSVPEKNFAEIGWAPTSFDFYVSDEPLTRENYYTGTYISISHDGNGSFTWNADGVYKYLYMTTAQKAIGNLAVSYSENAPQIQVKTPSISCSAWDGYVAGSSVNISTETEGATLHITTYIDGDEVESTTVEQSYTTLQLPGEPGQEVTYIVYASKEGYTDSDEAMESFDIVQPRLGTPSLDGGSVWRVYPGYELVYRCTDNEGNDIEGATITYNTYYRNWNQPDLDWRSESKTASLPLTIVVPENVTPGGQFGIEGTAKAEGYRDSNNLYASFDIISTILSVPTVSIPSGTEVKAGEQLQINRPESATEIHYVINGGEEIIVEDWSAYITLEEDCTIQIWATAEAPFTDSEVITVSYTIEKFGEWTDVIYPTSFLEYESSEFNGNKHHTGLSFTNDFTGATYNYQGRLWRNGDFDVFYITNKSDNFIFTTGTPKSFIKRFKIDADSYPYGACYILLLNEPFSETAATDVMTGFDDIEGRIRIGGDGNAEYGYGEWINLMSLKEVKGLDVTAIPHFVIYRYGQQAQLTRVCVEYLNEEELTGIEDITVDTDNGVVEVYNLNGIRVDGDNLAPGIYIRKANGKSEKFIVR